MMRGTTHGRRSTRRFAARAVVTLALPALAVLAGTQPAVADSTSPTFVITTTSVPPATWNQPYSFALQATGAPGPYTWNEFGALPPGLSMSSNGVIAGTPTEIVQDTISVYASTLGGRCSGANTCAQGTFTISVSSGVTALDPTLYTLQSTVAGPTLENLVVGVACDVVNVVNDTITALAGGPHGPPYCFIP
jgi:hypothetical protein